MDDDTTRQSVLFSDLFDKRLVVKFDQPHGSSDGGAVLLKAADRRLGDDGTMVSTMATMATMVSGLTFQHLSKGVARWQLRQI